MNYAQVESSQRQHHEVLEHQERMYTVRTQANYTLFALLKPRVFADGDQWCVLFGENIQEGIAGFGDTIHEAVLNFNSQFHKPALLSEVD